MTSLYYYTAREANGAVVRGSLQAGSASAALANLRRRSLCVTSLENEATGAGAVSAALQFGRVSHRSLVTFFRQFATLTRAGVSIRRSLDVTSEQCSDARLREALRCIVCDIENGLALSEAMARRPKEFPRLYVAMVKAGELGGALDDVLDRVAVLLERDQAVRKRLLAALAYPSIVSCTAIALVFFLLVTIVPAFRGMYVQMHVPLPRITALLIAVGVRLQQPTLWLAAASALGLAALVAARVRGTHRGAFVFESFLYAVPVAGAIARQSAAARFARTLGALLSSGVGLVAALEVVAEVVSSGHFRSSVAALSRDLPEGVPMSATLERAGIFEPMFVQMVRVGEETGALDAMLLRAAEYYELDVETTIGALSSMLEPAMILVLGGAVGFIVASVFIPLYTLIGSMK